eukprot:scaffold324_cov326-Pavlova_lutheri.AAC.82
MRSFLFGRTSTSLSDPSERASRALPCSRASSSRVGSFLRSSCPLSEALQATARRGMALHVAKCAWKCPPMAIPPYHRYLSR